MSGGETGGGDGKRKSGARFGARAQEDVAAPPQPPPRSTMAHHASGPDPVAVKPVVSEKDDAAVLMLSASAARVAERDKEMGETGKRLKTSSFPEDTRADEVRRPGRTANLSGTAEPGSSVVGSWAASSSSSRPSRAAAVAAAAGPPPAEPPPEEAERHERAIFGLLSTASRDPETGNLHNGVGLKFREPPEARVPATKWRLYVFRRRRGTTAVTAGDGETGGDGGGWGLLETLDISRRSAYLFGRDLNIADILVSNPSLSDQHAVLQYRALPDKAPPHELVCRPYLMDLGSTNGTYLNGVRLEEARYYELRRGDMVTLGHSSREYVLLMENTNTGVSVT